MKINRFAEESAMKRKSPFNQPNLTKEKFTMYTWKYFKSKSYGRRLFFLLMALFLVSGLVFTQAPGPAFGLRREDPTDTDPIGVGNDPPPFQAPAEGFTWSMEKRFGLDRDADGMIDYNWDPIAMKYAESYVYPPSWKVTFDGCQTEYDHENPTSPEYIYAWRLDGVLQPGNKCKFPKYFTDQAPHTARLVVLDANFEPITFPNGQPYVEQPVQIKDYFIVSIGDSTASGQGNPDIPLVADPGFLGIGWNLVSPAKWQDERCMRSALAGPAQAALALEAADPHSSVTFISFACSGASINTPRYDSNDINKNVGTGILGPYRGEKADGVPYNEDSYIPSQMQQLAQALQPPDRPPYQPPYGLPPRQIDALIITAGGNDIHFGEIATACLMVPYCWIDPILRFKEHPNDPWDWSMREYVDRALGLQAGSPNNLPTNFHLLGIWINALNPKPANVYITQYASMMNDDNGGYCQVDDILWPNYLDIVTSDEARESTETASVPLNNVIRQAVDSLKREQTGIHWQLVDGISVFDVDPDVAPGTPGLFVGPAGGPGHGYCASDRWIRRADESEVIQGPLNWRPGTKGLLHPNARGHQVFKERILRYMLPDLLALMPEETPTFSFSFSSAGLTSQPGENGWNIRSCDSNGVCQPKVVAQAVAASNIAMNGASILVNDQRGCNGSSVICNITPSPDAKQVTYAVEISASGIYRFQFNAQDSNGRVSFLQQEIKVDLENPVLATPIGPFEVEEGDSVELSASVATDAMGIPLNEDVLVNYDWDLDNDGIFETTDEQPTFSAAGLNGPVSKTIQVKVIDRAGRTATGQATVNVLNAVPAIVYDNFDNNVTDSSLWSVEQVGGPTAVEMNQRLEITLPANSAGAEFSAWYLGACQLRGDFDIRVDYELLTWSPANGVRISLTNDYANVERTSFGNQPYDYPAGPEVYLTDFAGSVKGITPTSDRSGKLRLARVGNSLTGFYFGNGGWITVGSNSDPAYTADTGFYLGAWSHDPIFADQEVKLAFDNMIIKKGELVCPPTTNLAVTQVADQETVSSGDPIGFTIEAANNGDGFATSVTLTDILPADTGLNWSVGGTDGASCTITAGILSCSFGDMPPAAVKSIRLTSPTPTATPDNAFCPIISNTATVTASNQFEGRSATASTTVLCPRVFISIWPDTPSVKAGNPINYTVTVGNAGEGIARDVDSETVLPNNLGLSWSISNVTPASAASYCTMDTSGTLPELLCNFDQLGPKQEVLITVTSPTTSGNCGRLESGGTVTSSNGGGNKAKLAIITINCPPPDTTPPTITLTTPAEGAVYLLGQTVNANYVCQDETSGSGLASCAGNVPNGSPIDTGSIGAKTFTVSAADNAGNVASVTYTYHVIYKFIGFTSPVDNLSIMNIAKAGQIIPLKWRITDANGNPVTNLTGVSVIAVSLSCPSAPTTDAIEEYATSNSSLQNLGDGYYQWNWKSPTGYANTCKTLKLDLGEGAGFEHLALFQFRK